MKWSMNKMNGMLKKVCSKLFFLDFFSLPVFQLWNHCWLS